MAVHFVEFDERSRRLSLFGQQVVVPLDVDCVVYTENGVATVVFPSRLPCPNCGVPVSPEAPGVEFECPACHEGLVVRSRVGMVSLEGNDG